VTGLPGRERETDVLRGALGDLLAGRGGVVVVTGEAGIGKTHLVESVADDVLAHATGPVFSAWAATRHHVDQPLRAWTEIGRALLRTAPGRPAQRLFELLDHHQRAPWTPDAIDAACDAAASLARTAPLLVVVDDASLLDARSVELLDRLLARTRDAPLLLVLVGRPEHRGDGLSLASLARGLRGHRSVTSLELGPLGADDVRLLVDAAGADPADPDVVRALQVGGGNPLLVRELLRAAAYPGAWAVAPSSARALLSARLRAVDPTGALAVLAVLDRPATPGLLAEATGTEHARLLLSLRLAVDAGVLDRSARPLQYSLALPPVRDALLEGIAGEGMRRLHQEIARALRRIGDWTGERRTEAARHLMAARAPGPESARMCLDAARWHEERGEHELACELAATGLAAAGGDAALDVGLLGVLGRGQARAGRTLEARQTLDRAVVLARDVSGIEYARAVAELAVVTHDFVGTTPQRITLLEQALAALDAATDAATDGAGGAGGAGDEGGLRATLESMLAVALYFTDVARSRELAERARTAAVAEGPPRVVALTHDVWTFATAGADATASDAPDLHPWTDPDHVPGAAMMCTAVGPPLERGDRGAFDFALARLLHHRDDLPSERVRGLVDLAVMTRAVLDADAVEVERLAALLRENSSFDVQSLLAVNELMWIFHSGQAWRARSDQFTAVLPSASLVQLFLLGAAVISAIHGDQGSLEELRTHVGTMRRQLLEPRHDFTLDAALCLQAVAGGLLHDEQLCRGAIAALEQRQDGVAVIGPFVCLGPNSAFLSWAHLGLGDHRAALDAADRAVAVSGRLGSRLWQAHLALHRALVLHAAGLAGAREAASEAWRVAESLGLHDLVERAKELLDVLVATGVPLDEDLQQVLDLAARGLTTEQIARQLFVSVSTVERRFSLIYRTLGVRNRAEAVAYLRRSRSAGSR